MRFGKKKIKYLYYVERENNLTLHLKYNLIKKTKQKKINLWELNKSKESKEPIERKRFQFLTIFCPIFLA